MTLPAGEESGARSGEELALPGGDFRLFVQKLGYQALIGLGVLENPLTQRKERHPAHAEGVLGDLRMLREKTRGNLEEHEEAHLETVIESLERHLGPSCDPGAPDERRAAPRRALPGEGG